MNRSQESVTVVIPGDLHLTERGLENHRAAQQVVEDVNEWLVPDFVQFIGDNVQDATESQFRLFDMLRARLRVPHFVLVGDHDVHEDPRARGFQAHMGATFGAVSRRGFRFLRLNTQEARPVGMSGEQVEWFRAEVESAVEAGERVVVFQHNYPYQIWEDFAGPGLDAWREVVQTRRIEGIFCGHTHYWQVANDGRNVLVATRSIGDPEGGPPGYTLAVFEGADLAARSVSVEERGPLALVTHPREALFATQPAHVVSGADEVRVRTWAASVVTAVRGRVNSGTWFALGPAGPGVWSAPLDGGRLSKGEHELRVECFDDQGRSGGQSLRFAVDPTGRYTAVPSVWPRVSETRFC